MLIMSIPAFSAQTSLFDIQNLLGRDFQPHDPFRLFADTIYPMLVAARPALDACYCAGNGRPAAEPVLLLGISLLQFIERLPDRAAIEQVRYHIGWKLALHLPLDLEAPDPSTLCNFRRRLLEHDQAKLAFNAVLDGLRRCGLLARRGAQRLDSTQVLGAVARLSSLDCLRQTLRLALEELERRGTLPPFWEMLQDRYVRSKPDYRLETPALQQVYLQAGADVLALLDWAATQGPTVLEGRQMQLLARVFGEHFQPAEGRPQPLPRRPAGAVQNPHDPEAQWASKGAGKGWTGFKAQVAETVHPEALPRGQPTPEFLTAIETQPATGSDPAGLEQVAEAQRQSGLETPGELYVDGAYVSAESIKNAAAEQCQIIGPALGAAHQRPGFGTEDFEVSVEERRATCPAGRLNSGCTRSQKDDGKVTFRFEWGAQCRDCPLRQACIGDKPEGRTLEVGQHHTYLQEHRRREKDPAFIEKMKRRNGIEGTLSELTRGHGLRRARYRGLAKARLQNCFIGAACNAKRRIRRLAWEIKQAALRAAEAVKTALSPPPATAA